MLSLFSRSHKAGSEDALLSSLKQDQLAVVDFNTIADKPTNNNNGNTSSGFRLWPFGGNNKTALPAEQLKPPMGGVLTDVNNKVIAMKKLDDGSNISSIIQESDDGFIDIQITKLSYAEVASLTESQSKTKKSKKLSVSNNSSIKEQQQEGIMAVVNTEEDLGKSITDLELAKTFAKNQANYEKFKAEAEAEESNACETNKYTSKNFQDDSSDELDEEITSKARKGLSKRDYKLKKLNRHK